MRIKFVFFKKIYFTRLIPNLNFSKKKNKIKNGEKLNYCLTKYPKNLFLVYNELYENFTKKLAKSIPEIQLKGIIAFVLRIISHVVGLHTVLINILKYENFKNFPKKSRKEMISLNSH